MATPSSEEPSHHGTDGHNVPPVIEIVDIPGRATGLRHRSRARPPDPQKDLWLSTNDGRYSSSLIPIRVGQFPRVETFMVSRHADIAESGL